MNRLVWTFGLFFGSEVSFSCFSDCTVQSLAVGLADLLLASLAFHFATPFELAITGWYFLKDIFRISKIQMYSLCGSRYSSPDRSTFLCSHRALTSLYCIFALKSPECLVWDPSHKSWDFETHREARHQEVTVFHGLSYRQFWTGIFQWASPPKLHLNF